MKFAGMIKCWVVCLAVLGFCVPQPLWAAVQSGQAPTVTDVKLHKNAKGNALLGQVRDPQGAGQANVPVTLLGKGIEPVKGHTDENGRFTFTNLRGGVYQVTAAGGVGAYRVWTPGTAPPAAQDGALIIARGDLVRGQFHPFGHTYGGLRFWLTHPCVIAGLVATAVAVPLLIYNDKDSKSH
jgi:hypothetical protein